MRMLVLFLSVAALFTWAHPSLAAKVVLTSAEEAADVKNEEKTERSPLAATKSPKDRYDQEKKEKLLQELRELYKQGRSVD